MKTNYLQQNKKIRNFNIPELAQAGKKTVGQSHYLKMIQLSFTETANNKQRSRESGCAIVLYRCNNHILVKSDFAAIDNILCKYLLK